MPQVGGVVHTHSGYATAWAACGEEIPCVLTAMADEFGGPIPIGPFALIGGEEIGHGIVETLASHRSPAVLMRSHGVFSIGATAHHALKAAVMCEDVARTVHLARALGTLSRWPKRRSTRSMTATRTSTASAEPGAGPARPRIGLLGIMQELYDDMLPGITERQAAYARELGASLDPVADVEVAAPARNRADIERVVREFEAAGVDGLLVVMLTYGPACASRARWRRRGCRSAWPTSSPCPVSRPTGTWPT